MNLAVIGVGYVGLVTAAIFADLKNNVWAVNKNKAKTKNLRAKIIPFYEPGLREIVSRNIEAGRLRFTTSYPKAIPNSEIIFICVGTPSLKNGSYNLDYIFQASKSIAQNLQDYALVVIKSTVPPGTNQKVEKIMKKYTDVPFDLASCPEFLREGSAVEDTRRPYRVIIGAETKKAADRLLKLHQPIKTPKLVGDINSAQLIKYAANAFLATRVSFINLVARLCDQTGADIKLVSQGLGLDPRIGKKYLRAGLGFGGSCLPKDIQALIAFGQKKGVDLAFLRAVNRINQTQVDYFVKKVVETCGGSVKKKKIAVLGLAFKPRTDDLRESRALLVIKKLQKLGAKISAYDPVAMPKAKKILVDVQFASDAYQAVKEAEALCLATEWEEFKNLDFKKIKKLMAQPLVVDGRNIYEPAKLKKLGFTYQGIGRK